MIRQELKGYGGDDRRKTFRGLWNLKTDTRHLFHGPITLVIMAMTEPPRDFTCCTLLTIFSYRESLGAITTVSISESISAIGTCLISAHKRSFYFERGIEYGIVNLLTFTQHSSLLYVMNECRSFASEDIATGDNVVRHTVNH